MATVTRVVAEVAADIRQYTNGLRQAARETEAFARDVAQAAGRSLAFDEGAVARQGADVARSLTRAITGRFAQEMSGAREAMARGLSNAEGFAAAGQAAARAYNAAVLRQIDGLAASGQLTAPVRAALVASLKDAGMEGGRQLAASVTQQARVATAGGAAAGRAFGQAYATSFGRSAAMISEFFEPSGFIGRTFALGAATFGVRGLVTATTDLTRSQLQLSGTARLSGLSLDSLQQSAAQTQGAFKLSGPLAAGYASELAKLAAKAGDAGKAQAGIVAFLNLGAARGYTGAQTLEAVRQAVLGIDEGTDKLFGKNPSALYATYAASIGTTAAKLTDAQKAQALLTAAISDGEKVRGSYADFLNTTPGKLEQARVKTEQLAQQIAAGLGPAFNAGLDAAGALVDFVGANGPIVNGLVAATTATYALSKALGVLEATAAGGGLAKIAAFVTSPATAAILAAASAVGVVAYAQSKENERAAAAGEAAARTAQAARVDQLVRFTADARAQQSRLNAAIAAANPATAANPADREPINARRAALTKELEFVNELVKAYERRGAAAKAVTAAPVIQNAAGAAGEARKAARAAAAAFEDEVQGVLRASGSFAPLTALGADDPQFYAYLGQARRAYDDVTAALGRQRNQFSAAAEKLRDYRDGLAAIVAPDLGDAAQFTVSVAADTAPALNAFDALYARIRAGVSGAVASGVTVAAAQMQDLTDRLAGGMARQARGSVVVVADVRTNGLQRAAFDMAEALRGVSPRLNGAARAADALGVALRSPASAASGALDLVRRGAGAAGGALAGIGGTLARGLGAVLNPLTLFAGVAQRVAQSLQPAFDALGPSLEKIANVVAAVVAPIFEALGPVIDAILPPLRAILQVIAPILQALAPALGVIANLLRIIFPIIKLASIALTYLAQIVFTVGAALLRLAGNLIIGFGKVIGGIARAIDKIPGINARGAIRFADGLVNTGREMLNTADQFKKASQEMGRARDDIRRVNIDPVGTAAAAAGKGLQDVADAAGKATDSVRNLADGFVVAAAVYYARAQAAAAPAAVPVAAPLPRTPNGPGAPGGGALSGLFAGATIVVAANSDRAAREVVGEMVGKAGQMAAQRGAPSQAYRYLTEAAESVRAGGLRPSAAY